MSIVTGSSRNAFPVYGILSTHTTAAVLTVTAVTRMAASTHTSGLRPSRRAFKGSFPKFSSPSGLSLGRARSIVVRKGEDSD